MTSIKVTLLLCLLRYSCSNEVNSNLSIALRWNTLHYDWPDEIQKTESLDNGTYIPKNNFLRRLRLWRDKMFVTIPRWKSGIPVTLAEIRADSANGSSSPPLSAYPSWSLQQLNNCSALQSVHSVEVDEQDNLWILDNGAVEELETTRRVCPPKLVIVSLNNNSVVRSVTVPENVLIEDSTLTCMTLDKEARVAFIADSNVQSSAFLVYRYDSSTFARFECEQLSPDAEGTIVTHYVPTNLVSQFVPIVLSADKQTLYFSVLDSIDLYSVSVAVFAENASDISTRVNNLGKHGNSVQITADSKGNLYMDMMHHKIVLQIRKNEWIRDYSSRVIVDSKLLCEWISSLEVDEEGHLWIVSSKFYEFATGAVNIKKENFRILKVNIPKKEAVQKTSIGFYTELVVFILFVIIIGLIVVELVLNKLH